MAARSKAKQTKAAKSADRPGQVNVGADQVRGLILFQITDGTKSLTLELGAAGANQLGMKLLNAAVQLND